MLFNFLLCPVDKSGIAMHFIEKLDYLLDLNFLSLMFKWGRLDPVAGWFWPMGCICLTPLIYM